METTRRFFLPITCLLISIASSAQPDSISQSEITRIISYLASDSLKGRGNFTTELQKAAFFIRDEFRKDSLQFMPGLSTYFQPFSITPLSEKDLKKDSMGNYNPGKVLLNVIGMLPGKSLADEAIIFSAHYDHLGADPSGEGIYNGANDNASGTTALLELARYYSVRNDNERTLIFCAFSGEELGLYGSSVFVPLINAENIKAVVNIEMIGRSSRKNSFFITGAHYSNFMNIIKKNLGKQKIRVGYDPDETRNLFMRSDNYPFARKGIPAHTIQGSTDSDECYHNTCDDVSRINLAAMTDIIRAIATGVRTLVDGTDTPTRIK